LKVWTRRGRDITEKVPEVAVLAELGVDCVLDGELVTGAGLPTDFYPLAGLMSARRRRSAVTFVAFDVLRLNGRSLLDYDLTSRRQVLDCLVRLADGALTAVTMFPGADLGEVLAGCEQLAMEGVVVKRRSSVYRPGRRTADWRKVKCTAWRAEHADRRIALRP
jgi:bifunctional non-homologous end joining protein LigD